MAQAVSIVVEAQLAGIDPITDLTGSSITDLTGEVITASNRVWTSEFQKDVILPVEVSAGIRGGNADDRVARAGEMTFELENSIFNNAGMEGYWTPGHANALADWKEKRRVRFGLNDGTNPTEYFFNGRVTKIKPLPGTDGPRRVEVTVKDYMHELSRAINTTALQVLQDADSAEAYNAILDAIVARPLSADFSASTATMGVCFHKTSGKSAALQEFIKVAQSVFDFVWVDGDGKLTNQTKEERNNVTTSQFTLDGSMSDVEIVHESEAIPDRFEYTVFPVSVGEEDEEVFTLADYQEIGAKETITFEADYFDPNGGAKIGALDVAVDSYTAGTTTTGTSYTGNIVVTIEAYGTTAVVSARNAGSSKAYLNSLVLTGKAIRSYTKITKGADVSTGELAFEIKEIALHYAQKQNIAEDAANTAAEAYASAFPKSVEVLLGTDATMVTNILQKAKIGNKITLVEDVSAVNHEAIINGYSITAVNDEDITFTFLLGPVLTDSPFIVGSSLVAGVNTIV